MEGVEGAVELSREEARVKAEAGKETRLPGFGAEETCILLAAPGASLLEGAQAPAPATDAEAPRSAEAPRRRGGAQARSARKIRSAPKRAGGQSRGDPPRPRAGNTEAGAKCRRARSRA